MEAPTGQQIAERTTTYGDKLEIYFYSNQEMPFIVVVNSLTQFPCFDWKEAEEMYDHFYAVERMSHAA